MDRFADVDDQYDPHAVEAGVFAYWDEVDAYAKTKAHRADNPAYFFVDGPPYTSGAAHMGTTWNKTIKDAVIRYLRMTGYNVTDRPGYDMHGLPIETKVEERLGFENKKDIEAYGIEPFIEECKAFADEQLDGLQSDFISFGVWMDWDNPYKTVTPEYMEAAWWGFMRAHENGLVTKGKRSISQCPRCETAIAKNEVEFHQVQDPSIYVKLRLRDEDAALVVWTTTPWTLPGNTFVAVNDAFTYARVRATGPDGTEDLIVESSLVDEVTTKGGYDAYEIVEELPGSDLIGWEYHHPLARHVPDHPDGEDALRVYHADYVEADRTGLVHSAPGHGEEDFVRGSELGFEPFCPVRGDGRFTSLAGTYADQDVREANDTIIRDLDEDGSLLAAETVTHDYGKCWRCDTNIIQIVTDQWFITITDIKDPLLENIQDSEWYPAWARDSRFRDFVEDAPDWNVSRQRYWGIPIPIWTPEDATPEEEAEDMIVIGTREELATKVDQDIDPTTIDLHKPTVDALTITENDTTYTRVPDVFDVWLDSSVATWGTIDYPASEEAFDTLWPADLIIEAHDQTRGWFWSQLGMGTAALGEVPYRRVLMHGHALDADGRKMSKSLGNIVEPGEAIDRYGRDIMRLFLLHATPQGDDLRFSWDGMEDMHRALNILWNVFRFPLPYMRLDGFTPEAHPLEAGELETPDEWILSRLQTLNHEMTAACDDFRQDTALDALLDFVVDDLSRYYVQLVRERMWEEEASPSKTAAYATLYRVVVDTVVLLAPFAPFVSERIYQHLTGGEQHPTVHMADWPTPDDDYHNPGLEADIAELRRVEEAGAHARQQAGRKRRWPVRRVVVDTHRDATQAAVTTHQDLLADRLNARDITVISPGRTWEELRYSARVDMQELGPKLGGQADEVRAALADARVPEPTLDAFATAVEAALGTSVPLTEDVLDPRPHPPEGVASAEFEGGTVYVDTTLTEDIEAEGYAREVIRRVQQMRKDLDLEMDERIRLDIDVHDDRIAGLVDRHEELIREEVRASDIGRVQDGHEKEWDVEGVTMRFRIEPLAEATA